MNPPSAATEYAILLFYEVMCIILDKIKRELLITCCYSDCWLIWVHCGNFFSQTMESPSGRKWGNPGESPGEPHVEKLCMFW